MKFTIEMSAECFEQALQWLEEAVDVFEAYDDAGLRLLRAMQDAKAALPRRSPKFSGGAF